MSADGGSASGAPRVSGMAIGSLILGLLGCTSPVGLILGIVAILQINNDPDGITGKGYAIAGIVVSGLMMLLGPALYVAAALPTVLHAREKSVEVQCMSNNRQLAMAMRLYLSDYEGQFPPHGNWSDAVSVGYGLDSRVYVCPSDGSKARISWRSGGEL